MRTERRSILRLNGPPEPTPVRLTPAGRLMLVLWVVFNSMVFVLELVVR